ncbi:MAG: DNA alkylation repair protein [bacterium]
MAEIVKLKEYFGGNLAALLAEKIMQVEPSFAGKVFLRSINKIVGDLELKARVNLIAQELKSHLMAGRDYPEALHILLQILGPDNPNETGMFKTGYWLMPVAKFVELYGLAHYDLSMRAIYEITKRHTGEYAIRPYIEKAPRPSIRLMKKWARDANVHVRRLASEGLRPRLPWAKKLDIFIDDAEPVLEVLELLKTDHSSFVKKSVANNMNDILKDHYGVAMPILRRWADLRNPHTNWIIKHALRNLLKQNDREAVKIVKRVS